jgi:hypothetical protein
VLPIGLTVAHWSHPLYIMCINSLTQDTIEIFWIVCTVFENTDCGLLWKKPACRVCLLGRNFAKAYVILKKIVFKKRPIYQRLFLFSNTIIIWWIYYMNHIVWNVRAQVVALIGQMAGIHSFEACSLAQTRSFELGVSNYFNHVVRNWFFSLLLWVLAKQTKPTHFFQKNGVWADKTGIVTINSVTIKM